MIFIKKNILQIKILIFHTLNISLGWYSGNNLILFKIELGEKFDCYYGIINIQILKFVFNIHISLN